MEKQIKRNFDKLYVWELPLYENIEVDGDAGEVRIYD